jgi:hypothetical protein
VNIVIELVVGLSGGLLASLLIWHLTLRSLVEEWVMDSIIWHGSWTRSRPRAMKFVVSGRMFTFDREIWP